MVGPLVICVMSRDAPVRFFTGYRRADYIWISNFIKYRIILDIAFNLYRLPVNTEVNKHIRISPGWNAFENRKSFNSHKEC